MDIKREKTKLNSERVHEVWASYGYNAEKRRDKNWKSELIAAENEHNHIKFVVFGKAFWFRESKH